MMDWRDVMIEIATNHPQNHQERDSFEDIEKGLCHTIPPVKPKLMMGGWREQITRIAINDPQNPQKDDSEYYRADCERQFPLEFDVKDVSDGRNGELSALDVGRVVLVEDMARRRQLAKIELRSCEEDGTWYCLEGEFVRWVRHDLIVDPHPVCLGCGGYDWLCTQSGDVGCGRCNPPDDTFRIRVG